MSRIFHSSVITVLSTLSSFSLLQGCSRESFYGEPSLTENIYNVYQDCSTNQIAFLKSTNNVQTIFEDCGSNYIFNFDWSPDGQLFYFQLFDTGYILNPTNKGVDNLPIGIPISRGVWVHQSQLVVPVVEQKDAKPHLAFYLLAGMLDTYEIPGTDPADVQLYKDNTVLLTFIDESGKRRPYTFDQGSAKFTRVFSFLDEVQNFHVAVKANLITYTNGTGTHILDMIGTELATFPEVKRAIPHPEGVYVALELDGTPITTLDQGYGTYKTPEAQKRAEERRKQKLEDLPDWMPKEVVPPVLDMYNVENKRRYRLQNVYGERFVWYTAEKYYCSFYVRGIGGKLINQNVGFMDLAVPLLMSDNGDVPSSIQLISNPE